ncbi:MAG: hypothetical protein ABEJ84_07895 [Halodesulfurarchaeum sp.]
MRTRDDRDWWWTLRAASGVALLLAGGLVVAVGGAGWLTELFQRAGAAAEVAQTAGFAIAALVVPIVLYLATRSVTANPSPRNMAGGGAILAGASAIVSGLLGGLTGAPPGLPLVIPLAVSYGFGTLVAFWGLLAGVSHRDRSRGASGQDVSWQAAASRRSRSSSGVAPADGGSTDSELSFPLDPDQEESEGDERE